MSKWLDGYTRWLDIKHSFLFAEGPSRWFDGGLMVAPGGLMIFYINSLLISRDEIMYLPRELIRIILQKRKLLMWNEKLILPRQPEWISEADGMAIYSWNKKNITMRWYMDDVDDFLGFIFSKYIPCCGWQSFFKNSRFADSKGMTFHPLDLENETEEEEYEFYANEYYLFINPIV